MRSDTAFAEPVTIHFPAGAREVLDAHQAYRMLHDGWPDTRAKWYYAAVRACSSA